jgi:hypothetical protein
MKYIYLLFSTATATAIDPWSLMWKPRAIPRAHPTELSGWTEDELSNCMGSENLGAVYEGGNRTQEKLQSYYQIQQLTSMLVDAGIPQCQDMKVVVASKGRPSGPYGALECAFVAFVEEEVAVNKLANMGPFIPINVYWMGMYVELNNPIICDFMFRLSILILQPPNFVYTTLHQHDYGWEALVGHCNQTVQKINGRASRRTLQFSMGGMGHVVVPLITKMVLQPQNETKLDRHFSRRHPPVQKNQTFLTGTTGTAWDIRYYLYPELKKLQSLSNEALFTHYRGTQWQLFNTKIHFYLAARGRGATTWSIYETLQLGNAVPVYVWDWSEWLPYPSLQHLYIMSVRFVWCQGAPATTALQILNQTRESLVNGKRDQMLTWIRQHWAQYFSLVGVIDQVKYFLRGERVHGKLQCVPSQIRLNRRHTKQNKRGMACKNKYKANQKK